jgi:hypothetical protein
VLENGLEPPRNLEKFAVELRWQRPGALHRNTLFAQAIDSARFCSVP